MLPAAEIGWGKPTHALIVLQESKTTTKCGLILLTSPCRAGHNEMRKGFFETYPMSLQNWSHSSMHTPKVRSKLAVGGLGSPCKVRMKCVVAG